MIPANLIKFAAEVQSFVDKATPDFGRNKVFISRAWRLSQRKEGGVSLSKFKSLCLEARKHGLLQLARADLVAAMDLEDVEESRTETLMGLSHVNFIEKRR